MTDKNLLMALALKNKGGGGSGSYMETVTFFSGNATAIDVGTGGKPEFHLEGIEGLDSSVKTITAVRSNATESNTYTLNYSEIDAVWTSEGAELQESHQAGDEYYSLTFFDLTDADYGKVYNITLSTESIEPNFKAAVEEVIAESGGFKTLNLTIPIDQMSNIMQGYAYWDITSEASVVGLNQDNGRGFFISMTVPTVAEFTLAPNGIWGTGADLNKYRNIYSGFSLRETGFAIFVSAAIEFSDSAATIYVFIANEGLTPGYPTD